jgi:hypothetical protein
LIVPKKRFSAKRIVMLLRRIKVLMSPGKAVARGVPRGRDFAAKLLSLVQKIRQING